jgi:cyanophycinase
MNSLSKLLLPLLLLFQFNLIAQGSLVLAGGGSEDDDWSDRAYGWGVEQSNNNRVGIISYYEEDQALPDYFLQLGAEVASNIWINSREKATSDTLYDYLMSFDFLFLKGGDQSNYYDNYLNTEVTRALTDKYAQGGVLGGTSAGLAILSGVLFSAEGGTVYPDQALLNIDDSDITLRDDFVSVLPGYIADSHFIERGRSFRLLAFLARWYKDQDTLIKGFGVDDKTAICISPDMTATVIGTGSVSFFVPTAFRLTDTGFATDSLFSFQLTDSGKVDLSTSTILTIDSTDIAASNKNEQGNFHLWLSGDENVVANSGLLTSFGATIEDAVTPVGIICQSISDFEQISARLPESAEPFRIVATSNSNSSDSAALRNQIRRTNHFIIHGDPEQIGDLLSDGPTGDLIRTHFKRNDMTIAFLGQSSALAGAVFCTNNLDDELASFRNRLQFSEGLGLLAQSVIMPHTIDENSTDFYENNTSAVLYALAKYKLYHGWYLNEGNYIEITTEDGIMNAATFGQYPVVLVENESQFGGFASNRNVVAATHFTYNVFESAGFAIIGNQVISQDPPLQFEEEPILLSLNSDKSRPIVYPNPTSGHILKVNNMDKGMIRITDLSGRTLVESDSNDILDISTLQTGVYMVEITVNQRIFSQKLVIQRDN